MNSEPCVSLLRCPRPFPAHFLKPLTRDRREPGCSEATFTAGEAEVGGYGLYLWASKLPVPDALIQAGGWDGLAGSHPTPYGEPPWGSAPSLT